MPSTSKVIAVVSDQALLRSIEFALEAHGYRVDSFSTWLGGRAASSEALCMVVDSGVLNNDPDAGSGLDNPPMRVLLLTDGPRSPITNPEVRSLEKPISGADLIATVDAMRTAAT